MTTKNDVPTVGLGTALRRIEELLERQGRENDRTRRVTRKLKKLLKRQVRVTVK
ncbi:MAG: hypothetical protein R3E44_09115 [Paracoccaceae bacterium]